jgi:WD40 repeat protein
VIDDKPELNLFESGTDRVVAASVSSGVAAPFGSPSIVSFGADGRELLLGTPLGETSRWSATSLRRLGDWTSPQTPFNGFTPGYSGDGAWFGYLKFGITVASTAEGSSSVRSYPLQTRSDASALAISPDASRVAVASEGTISVVQEEIPYRESGPPGQYGGLVTDPLSGVGTTVTGLAFVGGSQLLVSASQRTLALWDLRQQSRIAAPTGVDLPDQTEGSFTPELAVSPTGRLQAWVNDSGELTVAQAADGGGPPTLRQAADAGAPAVIFFAPDEHRIYSVASAAVEAWTLDGGALRKVASWPFPVDTYLSFAAATADAAAVYAMESDGRIHRISTVDGTVTTLPTGITGVSNATVALRPDGAELLVRDERDGTRLVDLHTGVTRPGPDFGGPVASVDYSPDGRYLAASDGQAIVSIWDVSTGRELRRIPAERVDRIFFNPAGSRLATITDDGRIALWDVADGARLGEVRVRQLDETTARDVGWQTQLVWEPSGTALWTATVGGTVLRWDLDPGQWVRSACAAAGRSLTADEWQQVIGSSPPGDLRCGQ